VYLDHFLWLRLCQPCALSCETRSSRITPATSSYNSSVAPRIARPKNKLSANPPHRHPDRCRIASEASLSLTTTSASSDLKALAPHPWPARRIRCVVGIDNDMARRIHLARLPFHKLHTAQARSRLTPLPQQRHRMPRRPRRPPGIYAKFGSEISLSSNADAKTSHDWSAREPSSIFGVKRHRNHESPVKRHAPCQTPLIFN